MKKNKVLIIKTGYSEFLDDRNNSRIVSLGDVLRTTPLLHYYGGENITWVTDPTAFPLLEGNKLIHKLLPYDFTTALQLESEEFDTVINLEKIPGICALSDRIRARKNRYGFTFNSQTGEAEAFAKAREILAVGCNPVTKKENKKTYQELLFELVDAKWTGEKYSIGYKPKNRIAYDVALNTQVGKKWPTKAWSDANWNCLEGLLVAKGLKVTRQDKQDKEVLNNLNRYMDWLNSAKSIVTNDSLGLHLGMALEKKVWCLFGPTPYLELYFYNDGEAITPDKTPRCMPCFKPTCKYYSSSCIDLIQPEKLSKKIINYLVK